MSDAALATVNGIPVHYTEHGSGTPVLALHGMDVDHREISGSLEPLFADRAGYRRIYPDLPGMGRTPAPETINSADDVLDTLLALVDAVIGEQAFLVVGQSYGGYLARAIASRRPRQVAGLALICPLVGEQVRAEEVDVPEHVVLHVADDLDLDAALEPAMQDEFRNYLVVQTPATLRRFQETVVPGVALADHAALARIFERWQLRTAPEQGPAYTNPTLILAGRQDAIVGHAGSWHLLEHYPRATFAVLDRAGHGLPHEQVGLLTALLAEWLDRVREHRAATAAGSG
ncbi:MAG: alpha/beta fold hydrolase [Streptosporangiales bacterium]|nr:alpha/beta fold hydrolase [Streptosporangiales bacterium]